MYMHTQYIPAHINRTCSDYACTSILNDGSCQRFCKKQSVCNLSCCTWDHTAVFANNAMIAAFPYQLTEGVTSVASIPEVTSVATSTDVTKGKTEPSGVATMTTKVTAGTTRLTAVTREHAEVKLSAEAVQKRKHLYHELTNLFGVPLKGMCGTYILVLQCLQGCCMCMCV